MAMEIEKKKAALNEASPNPEESGRERNTLFMDISFQLFIYFYLFIVFFFSR